MNSLLGIDPAAMRRQALFNGLAAAGFTLMGNKNLGAAGGAFLQGTNQGRDAYMNTALDAYRLKTAEEERQYGRERDAQADARWQEQFDYNKSRQQKADAWQNTQMDWQMQDRQQQDDMRAGQQSAVTDWMGQQEQSAGMNLLPPNIQDIARQGGVQPMAPSDPRYNKMQPYMAAQDYGGAFQQMTAEPAKPDLPNSYEEYLLAQQDPRFAEFQTQQKQAGAPSTTINNLPAGQEPPDQDLRKKLSEKEADTWTNYEVAADQSGGIVQQLQIVDELMKMAPQGPIQGRLAEMFPGFSSAGDALSSIVTRIAPALRTPGSGSQSDREFEAFLSSFPRLRNTPEGNAIISAVLQAKADIDIRRGEIVAAYRNNEISAIEARKQLGALRRKSILTPQMQQIIDGAGGGSDVDALLEKYGGEGQ
jgi:hypothetical protein